ncbi:hypothetical protein [Oscillatoria sp. FACHB-1406]|uniref:hypothetical protein n=1 Tax=Oscillatoria sp. FACHB-1406 TaxID=2692846 RepID=UPI00168A0407|nr:hypothetical protein [Oscillatoria sp. FACHB-1406]MBD2578445.1 hypothetical protein [Oscillatoria sp. FACHB-1406]
MTDIHKLLGKLAAEEAQLYETEFLAPCTRGGKVRASVAKMVRTFVAEPTDFEGWGIFKPLNLQVARVVDEPTLPQLAEYLQLLPPLRLCLSYPLPGQSWLAYPANESDVRQRFGAVKPLAVHLVTEGGQFEPIVARVDGGVCWFEDSDRRADPQPTERLREMLQSGVEPEAARFGGMTPEMRAVYDLAWQQTEAGRERRRQQQREGRQVPPPRTRRGAQREEERLRSALRQGGGELQGFRDRGDFWQVEWTTADGERHASAVDKNDLTVVSSGICLSGRDRDFDLQSLVGVIEQQE